MFRISLILPFVLLLASSIHSQGPYFIPANSNIPLSATAVNSMDIESADVDDDGDLDLVIASEFSRNLLLFNDGTGVFTEDPVRLFPEKNLGDPWTGEDSADIAFADFDNDNDLDIIFVSEDSTFHELLVNDGNGGFSFIAFDFQSSLGNAVAVLDLNNDSYLDVIIGNTGQNHVYINNQNLTFTQENNRWSVNTEGTQDLKLIDLDNDGDMDIVEGIDQGSNNILINNNGFFTEENNRLPNTGLTLETRKITLGDVNADTFPDIFISTVNFIGTANLQNRLYINDGNGFFTDVTQTHLPVYNEFTLDAVFIDYDQDNDLDLITSDFQGSVTSHHSFENNGQGVFTETTAPVFDTFTYNNGISLHSADLNGDTYPDLYFGNFQETDDLLMFDENALGVGQFSRNLAHVFPNPASDTLNIQFNLPQDESHWELHIIDSASKLVMIEAGLAGTGFNNILLDISSLAIGTYVYVLKVGGKESGFSGKFLIAQ